MRRMVRGLLLAGLCAASASAQAGPVTQSGSSEGLSWTAWSTIVGTASTATIATNGDPIYAAPMPAYSGVVALIMDEGAAGRFICSGALLSDRASILTAGHCVSGGAGTANPVSTTAYFYGGGNPDTSVPFNPAATAVPIGQYFVNPRYTGAVIDQNDIAVLRLAAPAPSFATGYGVAVAGDLKGEGYTIAGYGGRSDVGGSLGVDLGTGLMRQGDNRYEFRLGDPDFLRFFTGTTAAGTNRFGTMAEIAYSYLADFDSGRAANDAAALLSRAINPALGATYADLGLGTREVSSAGGDSGGPEFVNGKIASVTSYGLSYGVNYGDAVAGLNSSFGEFNGFVPTFIHADFILAAMVPEASSWAMLMLGLGIAGAALRRSRPRRVGVRFAHS